MNKSIPIPSYDFSKYIDNDILNYALSNGIIDLDSVHESYMASKLEKVKKLHPYSVTPPSDSNNRWQIYFKGLDGKRKLIRAQTEEELWKKLIPLYSSSLYIEKKTFYKLYLEWLDYKSAICNSKNTILRHKQHYRKYFKNSILNNMELHRVNEIILEKECNRIIREFNLSRKEWTNAKTILKGMFTYALRKKYIKENPLDAVQILVKFKQVVKKTGKSETYNTEELDQLNAYLDEKFLKTQDLSFMAVKLNFLMGLRVGELVAIKWTDICDENQLHIVREEIRDQENGALEVVEHTKTNTDRFVALIPKALDILSKIKHDGEYIFIRDGERITSRQINYVLEKYAERKGVRTKRSHKMRKTYASKLNANGVLLDCIREQLGHSNLQTTLGYIYNPLTEKETYDLITKALQLICIQVYSKSP